MNVLPVRRGPTELDQRPPAGWDPFYEFEELHRRMNQLFRNLWEGFDAHPGERVWRPPVDLSETDDAYIVEVDLPGVRKKDVTVETYDRELVVRGEVKERGERGWARLRTRRVGHFAHNVLLPGDVNTEAVSAALEDGVLRITAPKQAAARPRRVEITG